MIGGVLHLGHQQHLGLTATTQARGLVHALWVPSCQLSQAQWVETSTWEAGAGIPPLGEGPSATHSLLWS